jgi:hypothetical protein
VFHNRTGFRAQTRIERRLSATGLIARKLYTQAEAAKDTDDRFAGLWVERIDKTGDEELNGRHKSIVI